jgi:RNA polymerase sigma factor (sigma-70 family)
MTRVRAEAEAEAEAAALTFDDLYETHYGRLVAALQLADPGTERGAAEEVAQEAFVRVLVRWRGLHDPAAYLYTAAFRHQRRRRTRISRGRDLERQLAERTSTTTEDTVVTRQTVAEALGHLTSRQRACAVLSLYLGFTTEEVADLLRIRASTVRVHLHVARTSLLSIAATAQMERY